MDNGRTVNYTYDVLHRLTAAITNGSAAYPRWGLSWTYDRYGNRTAQSVIAGSGPSSSLTIDPATNRVIGLPYSYDANGNMTNDGLNSLSYDAENHVVGAGSASYAYDGSGVRVRKVSGGFTTVYVFSGRKVIGEYVNGGLSKEYVYSGSALIATHEGAIVKYHHADGLSGRMTSDSAGNPLGQSGHYPFGENWYELGGSNKLKFASYERDSETTNDYAMARYHINRLGRFSSPDSHPPVLGNPQSMNRYSYAFGDPINLVDPDGLFPRDRHTFITFTLCAMLGRKDCVDVASTVGNQDSFLNAATGLFGLGAFINYDKHFGIPCNPDTGANCTGNAGYDLHKMEDMGGPHKVGVFGHIFLAIIGRNPDTDANRIGTGFEDAWVYLGGARSAYPRDAINWAIGQVNARGSTIVGVQVTFGNGTTSSMGTFNPNSVLVSSTTVNGVTVMIYESTYSFLDDPNVIALIRAYSMPSAYTFGRENALGMALYAYQFGLPIYD